MNKPLNKKQIVDMDKLKDGDRIKFGDNSFGQITNYEIDISNLKGTIKRDKYIKEDKDFIAVKLDKHFADLEEWDNELHFDISKETVKNPYEMRFGTSFEYLQKAKLIVEK
jgi:hypothetical protein